MLSKIKATVAAVVVVAGATVVMATPAHAADPDFDFLVGGDIVCPKPYLEGYGPVSWCTELGGNFGGAGWYGPFNNEDPSWDDKLKIVSRTRCIVPQITDTGGNKGLFKGAGVLDAEGYGVIRPGVLYMTFLLQSFGRPGHYSDKSGLFHPTGDWVKVIGTLHPRGLECPST